MYKYIFIPEYKIRNWIIICIRFSDGIYSHGLNSLHLFPPLLCHNVPGSNLVHPWTEPGGRCLLWQVDRHSFTLIPNLLSINKFVEYERSKTLEDTGDEDEDQVYGINHKESLYPSGSAFLNSFNNSQQQF